MDKKPQEQVTDKLLEQSMRDGMELLAKAEEAWFSLPKETRDSLLTETVDSATVLATLPIAGALLGMLRLGYYYGRKEEQVYVSTHSGRES